MARWQIDIEKRLGSEFWSNRYFVEDNGAAQTSVLDAADNLTEVERQFHASIVTFTRSRISTVVPGDGVYTIVPINLPGVRGTTNVLPLFNTLRVDLQASVGRPSRKYYRGVLGESDIAGDAVDTAPFITLVDFQLTNAINNPEVPLVDVGGGALTGVTIFPFVQMRQLRRSRRRRNNGGGIFQ